MLRTIVRAIGRHLGIVSWLRSELAFLRTMLAQARAHIAEVEAIAERRRMLNLHLSERLAVCSELLSRAAERRLASNDAFLRLPPDAVGVALTNVFGPPMPAIFPHEPADTVGHPTPRRRPTLHLESPTTLTRGEVADVLAAGFDIVTHDPVIADAVAAVAVSMTTDDAT